MIHKWGWNRQLSSLNWRFMLLLISIGYIIKTSFHFLLCFLYSLVFTYTQFYMLNNLQDSFVFLVMDTWTSVNFTQFAERCFEMTKGRYILWNLRNFKMFYQFLTETRYVNIVSWTCFIYFLDQCDFSFLFLSAGWTDRQGRICILLE